MAIQWGAWTSGYSNNARLGIEYAVSGTRIFYNYYVEFQYNVNDSQTLNRTSQTGSTGGSTNYTKNGPGVQLIGEYWVDGSRGGNYHFGGYITGVYNGASPSVDVWISIPAVRPGPPSFPPTVQSITATTVRLAWGGTTDAGGATPTSDQLLVRRTSDGVDVHNSNQGGNIRDVGGLRRATTYQGIARIANAAGWSDWSWGNAFTTSATAPGQENAPGVDTITSSSARFYYTGNADDGGSTITANRLQVATNSSFSNLVYDSTTGNFTTVNGLSPSTTYYARVMARNGVGWGPWGRVASFSTSATVPGVPANLTLSNVTQNSMSAAWSAPASGGSAITRYDVQIATNSAFTTGLQTVQANGTGYNFTGLTPGTQYWVRVRAVNAVGAGTYSTAVSATMISGKPTIVGTVAGYELGTRGSGRRGGTVQAVGWSGNFTITLEMSLTNTFASILQTITLTAPTVAANNLYNLTSAIVQANGTYYLRAKVKNNTTSYESDWSDVVSYTQGHTPSASPTAPISDVYVPYGATTPFSWIFADTGTPFDSMSAYQLVIERNSDGSSVYDSGKTPLTASGTNPAITANVALAAALKNVKLRWRVRVWDSVDQVSSWSGYSLFTVADVPVVSIINPPHPAPIETGMPTFSWSSTRPSGGAQARAIITVTDAVTNVVAWTRTVAGTATTTIPSTAILQNGRSYNISIEVVDTYGLSGIVTRYWTVAYQSPPSPSFNVSAQPSFLSENGYVLIDWTDTDPDDNIVSWMVYRQTLPNGEWELLQEVRDIAQQTYHDWTAAGNQAYRYSVTQRANRSGTVLESAVGYYQPNPDWISKNWVWNPRATSATRFGTYTPGSSEVGTTAYLLDQNDGPVLPDGSSIRSYMRRTWTTMRTTGNSGPQGSASTHRAAMAGVAGELVTVSLYVRYSGVDPLLPRFRVMLYANSTTTTVVGQADTDPGVISIGGNEWKRISVSIVAPGSFSHVGWWLYQTAAGGFGPYPAVGDSYDTTGAQIEKGPLSDYVDGNVPRSEQFRYFWDGTANNSASSKVYNEVPDPRTYSITYSDYWLIDTLDNEHSMRVGVNGDSFSEEYESATVNVIGRGRHRDNGTRYGYTGTMSAKLRGPDARNQRKQLESMRQRESGILLRNPFGDIYPVALGNISVEMLPGTGNVEMSDVTIPYEEVY